MGEGGRSNVTGTSTSTSATAPKSSPPEKVPNSQTPPGQNYRISQTIAAPGMQNVLENRIMFDNITGKWKKEK